VSKLIGVSIAIACIIAALIVLLGTAYPAVALYVGFWDLAQHGTFDRTGLIDLTITLFVVAAHLLLIVACLWMAAVLIRRSTVSVALRWVAFGAFIATIPLAVPTRFNVPSAGSPDLFFVRYMWPALVCITISLLWSRRNLTSRKL
jgi:hypothetical protein